ncbi:Flavohemoprotein [Streptomyces sp. RB5]|uniref:nitric oxide dioxygenase n=1 Tax=Streptomyces smaragdinus TaxID=2585196 RepID=A0A7K0CN88_9ACTN|nr:globin domain-containing protein [Streptomyces smaragdinus]MQY14743.1 Flavohemoprotein [Streptomyces smaragdinus]
MLSPASAATVRASLPAVGAAIGDITPIFYDRMFAARPDLLRDLFNRGNQANGSQRQALAGSIAAFATALLEHPDERPDALLARIAHKHVSVGITPDQYPIVHEHLFAAIVQVLGEAVTPEVAAAWDEVYWLMANALIAIEARLYEEAGVEPGKQWRTYRVVSRFPETDDVTTFLVRPEDSDPLPASKPGQYVSVQVELADGAHQIRQYSLSGHPDGALQFAVKRDGEVSTFLHDKVAAGDTLRVSPPFGDVSLSEGDGPVLLASAGIGATPIVGMLSQLVADGSERRVITVHGDADEFAHAFRTDLNHYTAKLDSAESHVWYEKPVGEWPAERTGYVDLSRLDIPAGTTAYLCGPLPFLRSVRTQLITAGVRPADVHYEVFGPDLWLAQD